MDARSLLSLIAVAAALCLLGGGCHSGSGGQAAGAVGASGQAETCQTTFLGDLDGDTEASVSDAIGILRIVVGLAEFTPVADCDRDGEVGVNDAIMVLRCVVGLLDWPIGFGGQVGPDGQWLLWVSAGGFMMGSNDGPANETPVHEVALEGFWIGRCEVTNDQYAAFLNEAAPADVRAWIEISDDDCGIELTVDGYQAKVQLGGHPVVEVTWQGAAAYCEHFGYGLPTEAQWEYAARGPSLPRYPWGDLWGADRCCNTENRGPYGETAEVGSYLGGASWCGALDMAGNVWEWCADWYSATYYQTSPGEEPPGPENGIARVYRGGSWLLGEDMCRSARRLSLSPSTPWSDGGFRVARRVQMP